MQGRVRRVNIHWNVCFIASLHYVGIELGGISISRKLIQLSSISTRGQGRFGNQVYQYAFAKIYAKAHKLKLETGPWIGQYLFGHDDPPISAKLPAVESEEIKKIPFHELMTADKPPFANVDMRGQFSVHSKHYAPHQAYFQSLFQPIPDLQKKLDKGVRKLRGLGNTVVAIHVRRGDYVKYPNHPTFFPTPSGWYLKWLDRIWESLDRPVLFIATDDPGQVLPEFKRYRPVTVPDLMKPFPKEPVFYRMDPSFYPDYYMLTEADVLAISNSTFSYTASMLNKKGRLFVRPRADAQLIAYDPWNSSAKMIMRPEAKAAPPSTKEPK
jgi:hypothetical protein